MANRNKWWISPETLVGIANAIRSKKGTTDLIPVTELEAEIMSIVGDGGSWCGEYVEGTNYKSGAIVSFEGNIYLCIKDLDDQQDPTNAEYWKMLNEPEQVEEWDGTGVIIEGLAKLISFTINGTSYQAEDGMTWAEWKNSDYNTDMFTGQTYINGNYLSVAIVVDSVYEFVCIDSTPVQLTDVISSGESYTLVAFTSGGGAD